MYYVNIMDYQKIYKNIIEKRKKNRPIGYTERHHIIPRCLGGTDDKDNLVYLSAREHFICHLLLTKIYTRNSTEYHKMCHAFLMMLCTNKTHQRYITSRKFEKLRIDAAKNIKLIQEGEGNSQYGTMWIYNTTLRESKKVPKDTKLEDGWLIGRVLNFNFLDRVCKKCNKHLNLTINSSRIKCEECIKIRDIKLKPKPIKEYKITICKLCNINIKPTHKYCTDCRKIALAKYILGKSNKPCSIDGIIFNSVNEAALKIGMKPNSLQYRINSKNFTEYFYIDKDYYQNFSDD